MFGMPIEYTVEGVKFPSGCDVLVGIPGTMVLT
jgi:hypothetical protein